MSDRKLSIIIVAYNSKDIIGKCLDGISSPEFSIIVVDNGSADGTPEFVAQAYPGVTVIKAGKNLGYGRAANAGLKVVTTPYAMLINPDLLTDTATMNALLEKSLVFPNAAIFAPRTNKDGGKNPGPKKVDWVVGAAMLFNMELMKNIGFFDENIFLFSEESDLCKRVRLAGLEIVRIEDVYMEHLVGKSYRLTYELLYLKNWHVTWSYFYYSKKHYSKKVLAQRVAEKMWGYMLGYIKYRYKRDYMQIVRHKAFIAGGIAFLMGKPAFDENGNPRGMKAS